MRIGEQRKQGTKPPRIKINLIKCKNNRRFERYVFLECLLIFFKNLGNKFDIRVLIYYNFGYIVFNLMIS